MSDFAKRVSESMRNINGLKPDLRVVSIETVEPLTIKIDGVTVPAVSASPVVLNSGTNNAIALMLQRSKPVVFPLDPENEWPAENVAGRALYLQDEIAENEKPEVLLTRHHTAGTHHGNLFVDNFDGMLSLGIWSNPDTDPEDGAKLSLIKNGILRVRHGGVSRALPFATASGGVQITKATTTTVTLPANRFTSSPRVFLEVETTAGAGIGVTTMVLDTATNQFRLRADGGSGTTVSIAWVAIQLTP